MDGETLTYDAIGNPTSYYNGTSWSFTWARGRQLATASNGTDTVSYTYDADGLRTSKTVNGTEHIYHYASGKLLRETYGTNTLDFFYDASGYPFAVKYNGDLCYYITNLQGDVMSIVDPQGEVVAEYEYDPYGNIVSQSGPLADVNPLRYRGYVYDTETQFYYLQSRYYDPELGRFINADAYCSTGQGIFGNNMFVYCGNNPAIYIDADGKRWEYVIEGVVTESVENDDGTISVTTSITYSCKEIFWGAVMYESPESETVVFSYTISVGGVVMFDNDQDNAPYLSIDPICDALANEMLNYTREKVANSLSWRTVEGISYELYWHYICYSLFIAPGRTQKADIGGMKRGEPGYDSNAFIFECM